MTVYAMEYSVPTSTLGLPADLLEEERAAMHAKAMDDLEEWSRPIRDAEIPHRRYVIEDLASEAILQVAKDEGAGMIVLGRRGLGTFARLLLGSVSQRIVQQSPVPVVVVPPEGG